MNKPKTDWRGMSEGLRAFKEISKMSVQGILSYAAVAIVIYISAGGAYILGVLAGLPAVLISSINNTTIAHLLGQLTIIVIISLSLHRVSLVPARGIFFFWTFVVCKFYFGRRKPRGLRDTVIRRLQLRINNAIVEGRAFSRAIAIIRLAVAFSIIALIFFPFESEEVVTSLPILYGAMIFFILVLMSIPAWLAASRVGSGQSLPEFLTSQGGRKFGVAIALLTCACLGFARSGSMMYGPVVYYYIDGAICELAPMMPILGGNLYFDQKSRNFVVLSDDRIAFYVPHVASQNALSCK